MTSGHRQSTGPFRTTGIVGLDSRLDLADPLAGELGARFEPPTLRANCWQPATSPVRPAVDFITGEGGRPSDTRRSNDSPPARRRF